MKISRFGRMLVVSAMAVFALAGQARACEDDWLQVRQAVGPADQTRARLSRDMRVGFDDVPLGLALTTIQSRTGGVFAVQWDELGGYGLTKGTPMRLMPWRVASVNKTLHELLGGKITDRPVLSINVDGKVRIPGVRPKLTPAGAEGVKVAESGPKEPGETAATAPVEWPEDMPDSGAGERAVEVAGGDAAALPGSSGMPGGAEKPAAAEKPLATEKPVKTTVVDNAGVEKAAAQTQPGQEPSGVSDTGKFVEIVPAQEAQTPVSENDMLIAQLTRRGVRFNPVWEGQGLVAKLAPNVLSDEILAQLAKVSGVAELHVGDCSAGMEVSDAGLKSIGTITGLRGLLFRQSSVTSEGFKELANLKNLEWLDIGQIEMQRAEFELVSKLPKLRSLWLHGMSFGPADMEPLGGSKTIKTLKLGTNMNVDGWTFSFETLAKMQALEDLTVPSINLHTLEKGLKALKLKRVTLSDKRATDDHLEVLSGIATLEGITLESPTGVTREGFAQLAKLPRLRYFKATELVDETPVSGIGAVKTLEELDMPGLKASGKTLEWVAGLRQLKRLSLYNGRFGDEDLLKLQGLTGLESLMLSGNKNLSDKGLAVVEHMPRLEKLYVCGTKLSDAGLGQVAQLKGLTRLDICHTQVTDEGAAKLAGLAKLEELTLGGQNTDKVLIGVGAIKTLKLLEIRGSRMTARGLNGLRAESRGLRIKSWE